MKSLRIVFALLTIFCSAQSLDAICCGKLDVGPVYTHVDVLTSGITTKSLDMYGVRGDACVVLWKGLAVKPMAMFTTGDAGNLFTSSLGLGWYIPFDRWNLTFCPSVGGSYTFMRTYLDLPLLMLESIKQQFRAWAPYVGFEVIWAFHCDWRLVGSVQYAWSWTRTSTEGLEPCWCESNGPNWGLMLEHDLNDCWSVNAAVGYNISLDEDRHGLRAAGAKLGLAYWF
ncbi:MAG: hypothetical protein H7A37_02050 [Chlamydiales bacterium]|nr:hypothetical protein [Chlamydiales bacterium]